MTSSAEQAVDIKIDIFFNKTSATRAACDARARQLTNSDNVIPVAVQGVCSYSVYAGQDLEYVAQFRLESLVLDVGITTLATQIYGSLVPTVSFEGQVGVGRDGGSKEPLCVYLMSRVPGVTQLDFTLSHGFSQDSVQFLPWRRNFMADVSSFFALSWRAPQPVTRVYRDDLAKSYLRDLQLLNSALPARFRPIIQTCVDRMEDIMSLPMVLLHKDFACSNIIVDKETCHITGVVDWAGATICPFGLNLHSVEAFTGHFDRHNGRRRFEDYDDLEEVFWERFQDDVGGISGAQLKTIKLARVLGLLLSKGFTSRLPNEAEPTPIKDDERGRYKMMYLDAYLIDTGTKFNGAGDA